MFFVFRGTSCINPREPLDTKPEAIAKMHDCVAAAHAVGWRGTHTWSIVRNAKVVAQFTL